MTLSGHSEGISSVAWIDEKTLCSASWDHSVRLWDLQQATTVSTFVCVLSLKHFELAVAVPSEVRPVWSLAF